MKIQSYKQLNVWQKGMEMADRVYTLASGFPRQELYGLVSQVQKSAVSIPSNIAEGFARQHTKEYVQFLYMALGSCAELETQLIISEKRKYISPEALKEFQEILDHESRMLMNLIKSLR